MEFDKLEQFGAHYIGSFEIIIPPPHPEISPQQETENMVAETLQQILPFIGSGADELTDTGDTYRELAAALKRFYNK